MSPVRSYRGRRLEGAKTTFDATHRAVDPEDTLERIRPHLRRHGITRLADITGLDTTGVSVYAAIRPGAAYLAVDSGKGFTPVAAKVSAAMESLERSVAESATPLHTVTTFAELGSDSGYADPFQSVAIPMVFSAATPRRFSPMWDIVAERERWVPTRMVPMASGPSPAEDAVFIEGSNGLASGNVLAEAACSALFELVERDATACWQHAESVGAASLPEIDPATVTDERVRSLVARLDAESVSTTLYWCPTEIGLPVVMATLDDRSNPPRLTTKGYGAHTDVSIAMIRAVTEAVQARTLFIAGARDDLFTTAWRARLASAAQRRRRPDPGEPMARVDARTIRSHVHARFEEDLDLVVHGLSAAGFERVLLEELGGHDEGVSVVRMLVPGLEPYRHAFTRPGPRARMFADRLAGSGTASLIGQGRR